MLAVGCRSDARWKENMGIALNAKPAVRRYLAHRCPECASVVDALTAQAPAMTDSARVRAAEEYVLGSLEDFVMYTTPENMGTNCDFICGWRKERLPFLFCAARPSCRFWRITAETRPPLVCRRTVCRHLLFRCDRLLP